MSVDHLKKQAKNAKPQLAQLLGQPYSLAESQEFIARLHGYPSWHAALKAQEHKVAPMDDLADDCYDWRQSSLEGCTGLGDPASCRITEVALPTAEAVAFIRDHSPLKENQVLVAINATGEASGQLNDLLLDLSLRGGHFSVCSLASLTHRHSKHTTLDPFDGFSSAQVVSLFTALLSPFVSQQQLACCRDAVELLMPRKPLEGLDLPRILKALDRLVRMTVAPSLARYLLELFPDEDRLEEAQAFITRYEDKIPGFVRPLEALLARLTALGLDTINFSLHRAGLNLIHVDFGSEILDHLAALLVMAKVRHRASSYRPTSLRRGPAQVDVIWLRAPSLCSSAYAAGAR